LKLESHPKTCCGDIADPPAALTPLVVRDQWVCWKWQRNSNGRGWTKPPFCVDFPNEHAANNKVKTWGTYSAAVKAVTSGQAHGIGFVLTGTNIGAVDLDKCRDPETGEVDAWAQKILDHAAGAYVEVTVSGTGLRIIGIACGAAVHRKFNLKGERERAAIELYRGAVRYITVSGLQIGNCYELPNIDTLIDDTVAQHSDNSGHDSQNGFDFDDIGALIRNGAPEGRRSEAFARVVWSLAGQGYTQEAIEEELRQFPNGIAAKFIKRLRPEIARCYEKWRQQHRQGHEADDVAWHDPDFSILDDRRGELPNFPLEVFAPSWQQWAKDAAHGAGVTVDHVMVPLLGIAASLIGTARRVRASKSWSEPLTLWIAVIGFSGSGKSPGLNVTRNALAKIERDRKNRIDALRQKHDSAAERARAIFKTWKDAVKEAVEKAVPAPPMPNDATVPDDFVAPRLYISNSTIERIAVLLKARPRGMLMVCDELSGLFLNLNRYSSGTDRPFWLECWNGGPYSIERIGRPPLLIDHLLVGLVGGFQPDRLARSFEGDADGLYGRLLYAWPPEPDYRALTDNIEEVEPEFENALVRLIDLSAEEGDELIVTPVSLSPGARVRFEEFRNFAFRERAALDGREREWWAKAQTEVLRLSGTLAYLDWARRTAGQPFLTQEPNRIEADFVNAAVRLVRDYFWPHSRAALRQIGLSERHANARRALRWIRTHSKAEISLKDIRRDALNQSLDADQTQELLDALVKAGWLRETTTPTAGRSIRRWTVNPKLFSEGNAGSAGSAESLRAEVL
jgi:hypothetical protein